MSTVSPERAAPTESTELAERGWRDDPGWSLIQWDRSYWTSPPARVTDEAELTGGGLWCDHFTAREGIGVRSVATWFREKESV